MVKTAWDREEVAFMRVELVLRLELPSISSLKISPGPAINDASSECRTSA